MEKISSISTEIITSRDAVLLIAWIIQIWIHIHHLGAEKTWIRPKRKQQYRFGKLTRTWIPSEFSNELLIANAGMENIIRNG